MAMNRILKLFAGLAGLLMLGAAPPGAAVLEDCAIPDLPEKARCGHFEVPENPDRPDGRRISIAVAVIPATGGEAKKDPIVVLNGGPGEETIATASYYVEQFRELRSDRDLLFVDQRGTGRSASLRCDLYSDAEKSENLRHFLVPASVERCRKSLESRADLTQYSYLNFARDLEHVRRELGYGPMNLFAGSYGTRAAQHFLRAYPASVRTAYLGSTVPVDVAIPLPLAKAAQGALEKTFEACDAEPACHAAFPDPRGDFRRALALTDGKALSRGRFAEWVRSRLYRPFMAVELPAYFHEAATGDFSGLSDAVLESARSRDTALSFGLLFSITCSDDIPFIREDEIAPATAGTFLGDYRVREQQAACRAWPRAAVPTDLRAPVHSNVPTLFVSGDSDPATPVWFNARVAPNFPNRAEVVVAGHGHTEWNECISTLYIRLVRSGSVEELRGATCPTVPWPPFVIELPDR
jgi:pimeloyl-ACP methyl ester carboxylesterase